MIEHERSFLIKKLPENLEKFPSREIIDIYFPKEAVHPLIRLRKRGEKYELTKKSPIEGSEKCISKSCKEETIRLSEEEFNEFMKLDGKKLHKIRYDYDYNGRKCEIDVFKSNLEGLIKADFEFEDENEMNSFVIPDFCDKEVTHIEHLAGGMLCGKNIEEIKDYLN